VALPFTAKGGKGKAAGRRRKGSLLPELKELVGLGSFENDGSKWETVICCDTRLHSTSRLQAHAKVATTGEYEGLRVEPAHVGVVGLRLQSELAKEVDLVKHDERVAKLRKLNVHDRLREAHRVVFESSGGVWLVWQPPSPGAG
jgi:hypothetical protein